MGIFMGLALVVGCVVGLIITAILGGIGIAMMVNMVKRRDSVWWHFTVAFLVVLPMLIFVGEYIIPYGYARPGSDYDIVINNLFLMGIGLGASPGLTALISAVVVRMVS